MEKIGQMIFKDSIPEELEDIIFLAKEKCSDDWGYDSDDSLDALLETLTELFKEKKLILKIK